MADFRIMQSVSRGLVAFTDRVVDAGAFDDVAKLAVTTTRGRSNPLHVIGGVASAGQWNTGIFRPNIHAHTTSRVIQGTGASPLDDAVSALRNLGRRHGVDGINISQDASLYGTLKLSRTSVYESGERILKELGDGDVERGRQIAFRIDAAARRVLDFAGRPA